MGWEYDDKKLCGRTCVDGQYSNTAYVGRIKEALEDFQSKVNLNPALDWDRVVMHLPYAFQGRRMLVNFYLDWMKKMVDGMKSWRQLDARSQRIKRAQKLG